MEGAKTEYSLIHIRLSKNQDRFITNTLIRNRRLGFKTSKSEYIRALIDKEQREFSAAQEAKREVELLIFLEKDKI